MSGRIANVAVALLAAVLIVSVPPRLDAQITRHIKAAAKQGLANRKQRSEQHLLQKTAQATDSAAGIALNPVDRAVTAGLKSVVSYIVGEEGGDDHADERMSAGLDGGRLDLAGIFTAGTAKLSRGGKQTLGRLAKLLVSRGGAHLLEGFAAGDEPRELGKQRALAARAALHAAGVAVAQLFTTGGAQPALLDDGMPVTLTVRPLD